MTGPEYVVSLFVEAANRTEGQAITDLANQIIAFAATARSSEMRVTKVLPTVDDPDALDTYEITDGVTVLRSHAPELVRFFRMLMARMVMMGREELGLDLNPYGDEFTLIRHPVTGTAHLAVDIGNGVPRGLYLHITRTLIPDESHADELPSDW